MVEYIKEALMGADDYTVEQVYEFLLNNEYWEEVVLHLIYNKGGITGAV